MKDIGIVVVTYNRILMLKEVIEALRLQTYTHHQIIVINNGSTDNTIDWLKDQHDIITITQENLGGAGGFFTGMKYVAEKGYKYCWIMDDDVICKPSALEELLKAYHVKKNIGFVCSKVEGIDGCPMNTPNVDERPGSNGYANYYEFIDRHLIKIKMATFVSVFLSCERFFELGLPYKEYFIWGDDSEYTSRISRKYDCYLACKSVVVHKRAIQQGLSFDTETNPNRLNNYFYMFRNNAHRELIHLSYTNKIIYIARMTKRCLSYFIKGNFLKANIIRKALVALWKFNPIIQYPQYSTCKQSI